LLPEPVVRLRRSFHAARQRFPLPVSQDQLAFFSFLPRFLRLLREVSKLIPPVRDLVRVDGPKLRVPVAHAFQTMSAEFLVLVFPPPP